jgi:hypothetical protein
MQSVLERFVRSCPALDMLAPDAPAADFLPDVRTRMYERLLGDLGS